MWQVVSYLSPFVGVGGAVGTVSQARGLVHQSTLQYSTVQYHDTTRHAYK